MGFPSTLKKNKVYPLLRSLGWAHDHCQWDECENEARHWKVIEAGQRSGICCSWHDFVRPASTEYILPETSSCSFLEVSFGTGRCPSSYQATVCVSKQFFVCKWTCLNGLCTTRCGHDISTSRNKRFTKLDCLVRFEPFAIKRVTLHTHSVRNRTLSHFRTFIQNLQ